MKVRRLMVELAKLDPDTEVVVDGFDSHLLEKVCRAKRIVVAFRRQPDEGSHWSGHYELAQDAKCDLDKYRVASAVHLC